MEEDSYLENWIKLLPAEKQQAARRALREITESGDDGPISRLLVILELYTVVGKSIPSDLKNAQEELLCSVDTRLALVDAQRNAELAGLKKEVTSVLFATLPEMAKRLSVKQVADEMAVLNVRQTQVEKGISRLRHLRVGGMLFMAVLGAVLCAGAMVGLYGTDYQKGKRAAAYWNYFSRNGISHSVVEENGIIQLSVQGPAVEEGTKLIRDAQDRVVGIELLYRTP